MSEPQANGLIDDVEVVDAVLAPAGEAPRRKHAAPRAAVVAVPAAPPAAPLPPVARTVPAAHTAAIAATGFAAGAVTLAVLRGATHRRAGRRRAQSTQRVLGTRSFLVDVHILGPRG